VTRIVWYGLGGTAVVASVERGHVGWTLAVCALWFVVTCLRIGGD
jgi:hypothetical protein